MSLRFGRKVAKQEAGLRHEMTPNALSYTPVTDTEMLQIDIHLTTP